ncbi:MAG: TlpA disulfide reductase family protein [bacterium]|nr:TlpA disulfide reductase family protein [bacterium]
MQSEPSKNKDIRPKPVFKVPYWAKIAFFWSAIFLLSLLVGFQIHKRWLYQKLYAVNLMKPVLLSQSSAPAFHLQKGNNGSPVTLNYFANKWVLLHFWATWCPPCRAEMASLEWLHREFNGKLVVVTASVDDEWSEVIRFFNGQTPHMVLTWDKNRGTSDAFGVKKYPETFLISPEGKLVNQFLGPRDWSSKEALQYLEEVIKTK